MKKLAMLFLLALLPAGAQTIPSTANITAQDSGACSTAGACLTVNVPNQAASSVVQLTGTWSATIQFEGTTSVGGTFVSVNAVPVGGTTAVTSATANGAWRIAVAGLAQVRVRCSAFSSGPAVAAITLSTGSSANNTSGGGGGAVSSVFTRTGAVTAQSGDYTLDQVGSPAASKTFALGTNTTTFSSAGTFSNSAQSEYLVSSINSASPSTIFSSLQAGNFGTDAIAGAVAVPSSSVTNAFSSGIAGYVTNAGAATGCAYTICSAVGVSGMGLSTATGNGTWGGNFVVNDTSGHAATLQGVEIDVGATNTGTNGYGLNLQTNFTAQPTSLPAVRVGPPTGATTNLWTAGILIDQGSIVSGNDGIALKPYSSGVSKNSPFTSFYGTDGSGHTDSWAMQQVADNGNPGLRIFSTLNGVSNSTLLTISGSTSNVAGTLNFSGPIKPPVFTVSTLPSASTAGAGATALVSDATTFTVGTCTGGGSDYMIAVSNGSTWSCH